jgi:hypothetical protein
MVLDKDFARSSAKFPRETSIYEVIAFMEIAGFTPILVLKEYDIVLGNPFLREILEANNDSFDYWFTVFRENIDEKSRSFLMVAYEEFALKYLHRDYLNPFAEHGLESPSPQNDRTYHFRHFRGFSPPS